MSKVFIGVGHGGKDPGAVAGGLQEKDINLVMALEMAKILTRHGVEVALSRTADENDRSPPGWGRSCTSTCKRGNNPFCSSIGGGTPLR